MFGGSAENEATAIHSFTYSSRRSPDSSAAPDQNNLFWLRGGLVAVARGRTVGISRLVVVLFNLPFLDHSPFCTVRFVSRLRSIRCPMMIWRWNNTQTETGGKGRTERERWSDSKGGDRPPSTDHTRAVNNGVEMTYCEPHTEWRKMWFALASELQLVFFASQIHWEFMYNTGREEKRDGSLSQESSSQIYTEVRWLESVTDQNWYSYRLSFLCPVVLCLVWIINLLILTQ